MRTLVPRNSLLAVPLRDSARTVECWRFRIVDPIKHPLDATYCLKRAAQQLRLARLRCVESRPHDRSIEPLSNCGKMVIQVALGGPSILTPRRKVCCYHSNARSDQVKLPLKGPNKLE